MEEVPPKRNEQSVNVSGYKGIANVDGNWQRGGSDD